MPGLARAEHRWTLLYLVNLGFSAPAPIDPEKHPSSHTSATLTKSLNPPPFSSWAWTPQFRPLRRSRSAPEFLLALLPLLNSKRTPACPTESPTICPAGENPLGGVKCPLSTSCLP